MAISAAHDLLSGLGRSGLEQDFERLYQRHAEDVYRYTLLVLRSQADAEDVTQATFLRAYRAVSNGERVRKPQHWLITIAHNECRRHLRLTSRRSVEVELDEALVAAPEPVEGPTALEIRDALAQLSFNQRAALVMRELEDRSYAEIAEVLELTHGAVETLLFRARRSLREQMDGAVPCVEVEGLLLKQIDGEIGPDERRVLRAHTRACATCATLERQHRGRKAAFKRLGSMITLPSSLGSFFGGGTGAAIATGAGVVVGAKAVVAVVAALGVAAAGAATLHSTHTASAPAGRTLVDAARATVTFTAAPRTVELVAPDVHRAGVGVGSTRVIAHRARAIRIGNPKIAPPATVASQDGAAGTLVGGAGTNVGEGTNAGGGTNVGGSLDANPQHAGPTAVVKTVAPALPVSPGNPVVAVPPGNPVVAVPPVAVPPLPAVAVPIVTLPPPPPPPPLPLPKP